MTRAINKVLVRRTVRATVLLMVIVLLGGCGTVAYYHQAIDGQLTLLMHRQPIARVMADPETPPALRHKLAQVLRMRRFAVDALGLPDNPSYTTYVDLKRPYVVWNVFAAPALSLIPRRWCYPVAGCVSYRGYYSEADADRFAAKLAQQGNDVYVAGIRAYSTLGWFHDPMLNTMLTRSETTLAGTLFHELAHQQLYVKNDTTFNESFATTVELEGVRRWLRSRGEERHYREYESELNRKMQFIELLQDTRQKLNDVYTSAQPDADKHALKQQIFAELQQDYRRLRARWGGYRGYDAWFDRELNNAHLVPIGSYYGYLPAFRALLDRQQGDMKAFYDKVRRLAGLRPEARRAAIRRLTPGA